ncbi:MAG TPA: T9SS type A sorting domain-containing protein [Candidatus Sabulitectum sp.]|nr:T9SS type A sorting domain-containing protein [Candidatus Sabulitectum sp.]HPF31724.1 T9SS type A sorting domain-containing protein [Candidatus Sabulitectum sp.]
MMLFLISMLVFQGSSRLLELEEQTADGWYINLICWGYQNTDNISLCLSQEDSPHMSFEANGGIEYVWHDASRWQWQIETVADSGEHPDIELIAGSTPCILYKSGITELTLATRTDRGWEAETYTHGGRVLHSPRLAVDQDGLAHISYLALLSGQYIVCHAVRDGSGWTMEAADTITGGALSELDMDLNQDGLPRMAVMRTVGDHETIYAYFRGASGDWTRAEIDDDQYLVVYPNIACGTGDRTGITYVNTGDPEGIHLCEYPDPPVVLPVHPEDVYCFSYSPGNTPHVTYTAMNALRHMCRIAGSWVETSLGYTANSHDLAISSDEQAHIALTTYGEIKYMWHTGTMGAGNSGMGDYCPHISVSPSPADEHAVLFLGDGVELPAQIQLFDLSGRMVASIAAEQPSTTVYLGELSNGVYVARVSDGSGGSAILTVMR